MSASSSLPSEIIEAILRLLPAKSLGRFKSVSKTWNSLISHPDFIKKHLQRLQTTKLILLSIQITTPRCSLDTNQLLPYLLNTNSNRNNDDDIPATVKELSFRCRQVLGSCNGLVLTKDNDYDDDVFIFLINPTTHERYEVPLPPLATLPQEDLDSCPRLEHYYYGFGYDASTDDYKVVTISVLYDFNNLSLPDFTKICVSVYSLRNNSWKKLPYSFPNEHCRLYAKLPVVVNQNAHWYTNESNIIAFSFTTEEFSVFRFDLFKGKMDGIDDLINIGGKLGLFYEEIGDAHELWVMEDYGVNNSWTKVCCLDFGLRYGKPVCLVEGSNRDIILDVEVEGVGVRVFNIDEERSRNVRIDGRPGRFQVLCTYAESLESPTRILTTS